MALQNSFAVVPQIMDRHFGGTDKGVADPYVSGYHFIYWQNLPAALQQFQAHIAGNGNLNNKQINMLLAGSCLSVTPPGGTLNKAEFTGLGGTKWSVPTNVDYGNTLTIKFLEFQNTPILKIFHSWFRMIREYRTGTSPLVGTEGASNEYTKRHYSASLLYWTTRPDGLNVEYAAYYTGVFPTKDPQDAFAGDVTAVDKLEIDIEFSLDWIWQEPWVYQAAAEQAQIYHDTNMVNRHGGVNSSGQFKEGSEEP